MTYLRFAASLLCLANIAFGIDTTQNSQCDINDDTRSNTTIILSGPLEKEKTTPAEDDKGVEGCCLAPTHIIALKTTAVIFDTLITAAPLTFSILSNQSKEFAFANAVSSVAVLAPAAFVTLVMKYTDKTWPERILLYAGIVGLSSLTWAFSSWQYYVYEYYNSPTSTAYPKSILGHAILTAFGLMVRCFVFYNPMCCC